VQFDDEKLLKEAGAKPPELAFESVAQILALSRNLRNKATFESYVTGVTYEARALVGLMPCWRAASRSGIAASHPRRVKSARTGNAAGARLPPDRVLSIRRAPRQSKCLGFRRCWPRGGETGTLAKGRYRRFTRHAVGVRTQDSHLATRLAGLFRAVETPHWQRPKVDTDIAAKKPATQRILETWLPAPDGNSVTREQIVRLLDDSWLADDRLFCPVSELAPGRGPLRCRVDAARLAVAMNLYRIDEGKTAEALQDLAPKYFPDGLSIDPYSGESITSKSTPQIRPVLLPDSHHLEHRPDGIDHGAIVMVAVSPMRMPVGSNGEFDLITHFPYWP